jgi:hypothetical protein
MFAKGNKCIYNLITAAFKRNAGFTITFSAYEMRSFSKINMLSHNTCSELACTVKPGLMNCYSDDI